MIRVLISGEVSRIMSSGILLCVFIVCPVMAEQVLLNEVMASNSAVIADEDGDYEDWIELYNQGEDAVNLKGYYLSDDYADPYMWEFPEVMLLPGEYLLVWASGKDRNSPDAPLHTNFRIARRGEEVYLTGPDGRRLDEVAPTPIPTDMAYGRHPDGTGSWHYLKNPTPGSSNAEHIQDQSLLMHYWFFDTGIPNNTPLKQLKAFYSVMPEGTLEYRSCLPGYPYHEGHDYWRKASMERRNRPTAINYRHEGNDHISYPDTDIRGIQVRAPFYKNEAENTIILHVPSTGFENLVLRFAARDEGAAEHLVVDYAVDDTAENWTKEGIADAKPVLKANYRLFEVDFQHISQVNNNPDFKIRIRFGGDSLHLDDGSRVTFNNISLDGTPLKAYYIRSSAGDHGHISPYGFNRVYQGNSKSFYFFPAPNHVLSRLTIDGSDVTEDLSNEDDIAHYTFGHVTDDHHIAAEFTLSEAYLGEQEDRMLIYPNPATTEINIKATETIDQIRLVSLTGALVYERTPATEGYHINTGGFASGMYVLHLVFADRTVSRKVRVVRF